MIYFFYPSNITGGAEYLMVNTANLLCNAGFDVGVVDYKGGWVESNINSLLIKKEYIYKNKKVQLQKEDVLITTANHLYKLDNYFLMSETKVLFWVVQPYNVILDLPKISYGNTFLKMIFSKYLIKKRIIHKKNLELIINKNAIVSMDKECDRILKANYSLNYNVFLPIFICDEKFNKKNQRSNENNILKMVWLGRIDLDFKIHILKKTLLDLNFIKQKYDESFEFNIVGAGHGLSDLKSFVNENISFKVNFLGELRYKDLNSILEKSDIGFAMGTSALEIAAKNIPTILLDFSYCEVFHYKYRWIFETDGYILGRDIEILSKSDIKNMKSLDLIFSELKNNHTELSKLSSNYVYINHSSNNTLKMLKEYIDNTELTLNDIYQYSSTKPIWNKICYYLMKLRRFF